MRTGGGQLVSQYAREPQQNAPTLRKDFLYGAGQLLVERSVSGIVQTITSSSYFYNNGQYGFAVLSGDDGGPYSVDVRTESGAATLVSGVTLDTNGELLTPA